MSGPNQEVTLVESKGWWSSTAIWGAILGIVGTVLGFFNIAFSPEVQAQVVDGAVKIVTGWTAKDYGAVFSGLTALVGAIMSIWGRKSADQPVHFFSPYVIESKAPLKDVTPAKAEGMIARGETITGR